MTVLLAKSTFYHKGELKKPGDPVLATLEIEAPDERSVSVDHYIDTGLCEYPDPDVHEHVADAGDGHMMIAHGGGWYSVCDDESTFLDKVQGVDKARTVADTHANSESTDE